MAHKNDGLSGNLIQTLASVDRPPQLQLLLRDTPIKAIPPDAALYLALSMYCFAEAAEHAAAGKLDDAFDRIFDAHQALQFRHGDSMWRGCAEYTYATIMLMAGVAPAYGARQLGHSVEMFLRTYAKWIDGGQNAVEMGKLETLLAGPRKATAAR